VDIGYYILSHLAYVAAQSKGKIAVGGVINFIVDKLDSDDPDDIDYIQGNLYIDLDYLKNIHMVREIEGPTLNYRLMIFGEDSIVLPDPLRTDITKEENWLYRDIALQVPQGQHEQGEPQGQHAQEEPQHQQIHDDAMGDD